jgi:hypothetical protein
MIPFLGSEVGTCFLELPVTMKAALQNARTLFVLRWAHGRGVQVVGLASILKRRFS